MKTTTILILSIIYLTGCNSSPKSEDSQPVSNKKTASVELDEIQIQVIENWPDEIDGCSCYSSRSQSEFKKREYIYMDNYGDIAFMKINGQLEKFKLTKSDTLTTSDHSRKIWTNKNFEFSIETKQVGQIDETWQHEGKLTLKLKDGEIIEQDIYGECGC